MQIQNSTATLISLLTGACIWGIPLALLIWIAVKVHRIERRLDDIDRVRGQT